MPAKLIVNVGEKYGLLTVVKEVPSDNRCRRFLCACDCGKETETRLADLRSGRTRSCGCLWRSAGILWIWIWTAPSRSGFKHAVPRMGHRNFL